MAGGEVGVGFVGGEGVFLVGFVQEGVLLL